MLQPQSDGTKNFISFDEITLKLFVYIAETGEYDKLSKKGGHTPDECYEKWELIVRDNNKSNGNYQYSSYLDHCKAYNSLLREYNVIKATLITLCFTVDDEQITYLKKKGYVISTTSREDYVTSLNAAFRKSDNLITRIGMKKKQIEKLTNQVGITNPTFDQLMAGLIHAGYTVTDDITLVRYNELKKLIDKDNENGGRTGRRNKDK